MKLLLARKLNQSITKSSKSKLIIIWTKNQLRFHLYHQEALVDINF